MLYNIYNIYIYFNLIITYFNNNPFKFYQILIEHNPII
jgi:hypothetical protein